jgi:formylmethanofuran dehydrogenase subunit B
MSGDERPGAASPLDVAGRRPQRSGTPPADAPVEVVDDAVCLGCGCTCDDIRLRIQDNRIVAAEKACSLGVAWFGSGVVPVRALDGGVVSTPQRAIDTMARVLTGARAPLVYMAPDVTCETQRQAIAIADLLHATLDSVTSATSLASILAAQQRGRAGATLGEIRNRADVIVFWAVDPAVRHPRFQERYAPAPRGVHVPEGRRSRAVIAVDVGEHRGPSDADLRLAVAPGDEVAALARLTAALTSTGAPESTDSPSGALEELALRLRNGRYVVVVADGETSTGDQPVDRQRSDALVTLSLALNASTRGALSLLRSGGNRSGADAAATWQTGFPLGIDFARGYPRYAPWTGNAVSRVSRGEIDAMLIVGNVTALPAPLQSTSGRIATCVIGPHASESDFSRGAAVVDTGLPGIHSAGTVLRMDDVPLPVRANFRGAEDAEVITRALCERIVAVQRDARLEPPVRISR